MKRSMTVISALALGMLALTGGSVVAQTEESTPLPVPSYQPMPAADPVAAVDAFLDALDAGQWSSLPALACSAERDSFASSYDPAAQTYFSPEAVEVLFEALGVDVIDRVVRLASREGDTATVTLAGTLSWTIADEGLESFVDALAADASPAPTEAEKAQAVQDLRVGLESRVLAPELRVVAEAGGWLLCTDIMTDGAAE
jgi:hypothetical protein